MSVFYGRWSRHIYRLARVAMATPILVPSSWSCPLASPEWPPSSWSWPWQPIASGLRYFWNPHLLDFLTCFGVDHCCRHDDPQFCWRSSPPTVPSLTNMKVIGNGCRFDQSHLILELLKLTFELHHVKFRTLFLHTSLLLGILHFVQLLLQQTASVALLPLQEC